jgi:hypothetical protein
MAPDEIPPFERSTTATQSMTDPPTTDLPTADLPTADLPTEAAASAEPPQLETPVDTADPQVAAAPNAETVGPAIPEPKAGYAPEPEVTAVAASPTMANPVMIASVELRAAPAPQPKTESQVVAARPVGPGGPQAAPARIDALAPRSAPAAAMIGPATTKPVQLAAFEPPAAPESGPKPVRLSLDQPAAILVTVPLPRARPALRAKARPAALHIAARPAAAPAAAPSLGPKSVAAKPIVKPAGSRAKRTATHTARAVRPDNTTSTGLFPFGDLLPPPPLPNPFGQ